jgi:hypothetical protein
MLKAMRLSALMVLAAALPALADTRFQIRRMNRDDVPLGKGQCDIRLQVDNEVEVQVRGDTVQIHTIAGQDARDDGSECNAPLPNRDIEGFNFEVKDSRNEIRLLSEPSRRNNFSAIVRIRDGSGGFGRYHFRLTWGQTGSDYRSGGPGPTRPSDGGFDRPRGGGGFAWNNTVNFRGNGRGEASTNSFGQMRLGEVNIDIDRGGKIFASFRAERGRTLTFSGNVVAREGNRWKADVVSDDRRLRGPMYFSVDDRGDVNTVSIEAGDGRDRMKLSWDRR